MRFKKIVSGLLACVMAATTVFTGNVVPVRAEATPEAPKYSFNFDSENLNSSVTPDDVFTVIGAGNTASTATPVYETGRTGEAGDKSVKLGDYALSLPGNIGENYTVNVWVKPNEDTIANNHAIFLLGKGGSAEEQEWVGFAGNGTKGKARVWGKYANAYQDPIATVDMVKDQWTMLTLAQEGSTLEVYQDGVLKGSKSNAANILKGADKKILLGSTYWADGTFNGWMDEVQIYDKKLTANQIYKIFDPRTEVDIFADGKMTVSGTIRMFLGGVTTTMTAVPPSGVDASKITYSYSSADDTIATVDAAGVVTAHTAGTTTITTTAVYDGHTDRAKTGETTVIVRDPNVKEEGVVVDYDLTREVDGKLKDISGNGNDATLHGEKYSFENGELKLDGDKTDAKTQTYVDLPIGIMDKLTDQEKFTIQVKFAKTQDVSMAWLFCFGSNPKDAGTNYMFLSPNFQNTLLRAGIKDSTDEKLFATSLVPEKNKYYTVNMVFDEGKIKLYWNGVMIKGDAGNELDSGYNIMEDVVTPGCKDGILGYIGKSCWAPDEYFKGLISEFKIYDKVMTDEEIQLSDPAYQRDFEEEIQKELTVDKILGKNDSKDEIKYNLSLPETVNEVSVTWSSDKKDVISNEGIVKCKDTQQPVKMTATAKSGALEAKVEFDLTVQLLDRQALDAAIGEANAAKNAADFKYYTAESRNNLTKLLDKAADVANQDEADALTKNLKNAVARLAYIEEYIDPFAWIDESKFQDLTVAPKGNSDALSSAVPESVKPYVSVEYGTSRPEVASVDKNTGKVTGVALGYAIITTKVKAVSDEFEMEYYTLVKVDLDVKGVAINAVKTNLAKGEKTDITVNLPAAVQAAGAAVSYRATGVVSVSNGKVTANKAGDGTVVVKVKAGGKTVSKKLNYKVGEITGASKVKVNKSITLKVAGLTGKVTWSLDKKGKKLASISKSGKFKAKKKTGKVTVTAKVGNVTMKKTINIKK